MLSEFLAESRKIIQRVEKIRTRHANEIEAADFGPIRTEANLKSAAIERLLAEAETDTFSYELHEIKKDFSEQEENGHEVNTFDLFLRISRIAGGDPLYKSIWAANSSLELVYEAPSSPASQPKFEPYFFADACISASILRLYVEVADQFGEPILMAILNGAELDFSGGGS